MTTINPKNLRILRDRRNWTLDDLAERSKVERGTISKVENGKRPNPRASTVRKLASALNVDMEVLVGPDLEIDGKDPVLAPKSQMNFKMASDARNALSLVALRYDVRAADILHMAPFLFYWAAEACLKWREEKLDAASEKLAALKEVSIPPHLSGVATHHWQGEEILDEERRSIARRDIFGSVLSDDIAPPEYEESEHNPMAQFFANIAATLGDNVEFEHWSPSWSHPGYMLGWEEARSLCGGDEEAARHIVHGNAPLHEMPKQVREEGENAIAKWASEVGEANLRDLMGLDDLTLKGGL